METLREFRESLGYSKQEIADALHISKSFYEKIEWGIREPSHNFLRRFKKSFPTFDMNIFFEEKRAEK